MTITIICGRDGSGEDGCGYCTDVEEISETNPTRCPKCGGSLYIEGTTTEWPEDRMGKETMYADTVNGDFDMTRDDVIQRVKDNRFFSHPADVAFVDSDGVEYTGQDALDMAGVENEQP